MKKRIKYFLTAAILLIAAGLLYYFLNLFFGFSLPCVFNVVTGLYCPGCGVTRMLMDITRLDFAAAFAHNQVLFIEVLFIMYLIIKLCYKYLRYGKLTLNKADEVLTYILIAVLIIFGVLRNIPALSFLTP